MTNYNESRFNSSNSSEVLSTISPENDTLPSGAPTIPRRQSKATREPSVVGKIKLLAELRQPDEVSVDSETEPSTDLTPESLDNQVVGTLYTKYEARIYAYIYRRTGEEALADDLTSQVFLKMLEAIKSGKAWRSSFSGWIYKIAHNTIIDYYRQRGRQQDYVLEDTLASTAHEHDPVLMHERFIDANLLRAAIARLNEDQAKIITLRFLEGYSIPEVAEILGKTEGSVKAMQSRGINRLQQLLQHAEFNGFPKDTRSISDNELVRKIQESL